MARQKKFLVDSRQAARFNNHRIRPARVRQVNWATKPRPCVLAQSRLFCFSGQQINTEWRGRGLSRVIAGIVRQRTIAGESHRAKGPESIRGPNDADFTFARLEVEVGRSLTASERARITR
jgi:hypothetical protein